MIVGIPREMKVAENRVSIVPGGVEALIGDGHRVLVEKKAGAGAGISDQQFAQAGATVISSREELWHEAEMIIKVKEPVPTEYDLLQEHQIIYTYLHLAAHPDLADALLQKNVTAIGYETIELEDGSLPLLRPMSEVAGRMSVQAGAQCLEKHNGGKGLLLSGVPGVRRGRVTIIGGGVAGVNAAKIAVGLGAQVTIIDINPTCLAQLDNIFGNSISTLMSNSENVTRAVRESDLVVGAVLVTGAKAPVLVSEETVKEMESGSVIVDIAIDQGGCIATSKTTTHIEPTYELHDVLHYGVPNIPGGVPKTSTYALTNVTLEYARMLAGLGPVKAFDKSSALRKGLNTHRGKIMHKMVATSIQETA